MNPGDLVIVNATIYLDQKDSLGNNLEAQKNEIGICLSNTSYKELKKFLFAQGIVGCLNIDWVRKIS